GHTNTNLAVTRETDKPSNLLTLNPAATIFKKTIEFKFDIIAERMRELAFLNPEITIELIDDREEEVLRQVFHYDGGVVDFVKYLDENRDPLMQQPIFIQGEVDDTPVAVALQYNSTYNENVHSFVNNINTHEGGTHVSGFRRALTRSLKTFAEKNNLIKGKVAITGDDFREGLTAVIS